MGDNTFRYGQGAPGARVRGAGAGGPAAGTGPQRRDGAQEPAGGTGWSVSAAGGTGRSDSAAGRRQQLGPRPDPGRADSEMAAEGSGSGERRGFQRAAALAGRAMPGRGGVGGHGGHASALLDRIPTARRDHRAGTGQGNEASWPAPTGGGQGSEGPGPAGDGSQVGDGGRAGDGNRASDGNRAGDGGANGGMVPPPGFPGLQIAPAATYWRRRFAILAIGLSLLAAASWTLSQAVKVSPSPRHSSGQSGRGNGTNTAPSGTGHHGHGTSGATTGHASTPRAHVTASGPAAKHQPAPRPSATTSGFGGFKPAFCSWHSIVLSLSAAQVHYGPGVQPSFSLSVVSTQPTACSFNIGPSHFALIIKEGPARIWSSADCVNGSGNLVAALHRGVPTVVTIGWDRRTSSPGCTGPARSVPPGTYTGYAVDGSLVSGPVPIRLS